MCTRFRQPAILPFFLALPLLGQTPEFMSFESAQPILKAMTRSLPPGFDGQSDAAHWNQWLSKADAGIRQRLEAGEEDSLSNLLRFGVTFTREYRIDDEYFARYGDSSLVNSFASHRADDLLKALSTPNPSPGLQEMRAFLERKGLSPRTPSGRQKLKRYLLANLDRMHGEFLTARQKAKTGRSQMFQDRGISLDSNLWPDYDLDWQLRRMREKGALKPGAVHRVAIIGPGLDFVNKQEGVDFYPPQTIQPFAVMDSLLRQGLANPDNLEIYTLDISSRVNLHIAAARTRAAQRRPYTLQLPWYANGRWTDEFRGRFVAFWQGLGSKIGEPVDPITPPEGIAGISTRAVRIRPDAVQRIKPVDMNIVYQNLPGERFDLIIGTNIFLYYGEFEQLLARRNVAAMLKPGGYLLSNDKLPDTVPSALDQVMQTEIPMTTEPVITDLIFCYQRLPDAR